MECEDGAEEQKVTSSTTKDGHNTNVGTRRYQRIKSFDLSWSSLPPTVTRGTIKAKEEAESIVTGESLGHK